MNLMRKFVHLTNKSQWVSRSALTRPSLVSWFSIKANLSLDNENLEVNLENESEKFPLVWLRDNCTCENCFHKQSSSRIINWNDFNVDPKVASLEPKENQILIKWSDNHKSEYSYEWLRSRSFLKKRQKQYLEDIYRPKKRPWSNKEFFEIMNVYQYKDITTDDTQFYNWLNDLIVHGMVLIENAPTDEKEGTKLADKIAFIRKTHYGADYQIKAKPGTQNVAYLSSLLQLHTDLPYYHYKPGVNLLHCIVQTESKGGESLLTDVFYVAEKIRNENKEIFDILTGTDVNWYDVGEEDGVKFNKIHRCPMISLDSDGNIAVVRHSIPQRDSHFTVNLKDVKPWYKAMKVFVDEINAHAAQFKLKPGDILAFDNTRLVHGRLAYKDTDKSQRFLIGIFLDWDEVYSKWRIIKKELGLYKE